MIDRIGEILRREGYTAGRWAYGVLHLDYNVATPCVNSRSILLSDTGN